MTLRTIATGLSAIALSGVLGACGGQPAPRPTVTVTAKPAAARTSPPAPTSPAAPGPVSTTATLDAHCSMGYLPGGQGVEFIKGAVPTTGFNTDGTTYYPTVGYEIMLTNNGTATADITGWVVAFYDSSGTELGSDEESISDEFLTGGQSFNFVRYSSMDTDGGDENVGSDASIPSDGSAATCQVIQWLTGSS
jgi:hypothetical protein